MIRCWIVNGFHVGKHPLVEKGWACVDVVNPRVEPACFNGWWSTNFFPTINHSVVFSNLKLVIKAACVLKGACYPHNNGFCK